MTSNLFTRYIVILGVIALSVFSIMGNWPVSLGIDLRGGSVLTYRIEEITGGTKFKTPTEKEQAIEDTLEVISQRINKEGVKDITVRREGLFIVITLPEFTDKQTASIRERMTQMGRLEMPVEATNGDKNRGNVFFDVTKFEQARVDQKAAYKAPESFRWLAVLPQAVKNESPGDYKVRLQAFRDKAAKEPWTLSSDKGEGAWYFYDPDYWGDDLEEQGFTGRDIVNPMRSQGRDGGRAVSYEVKSDRQWALGSYSTKYRGRQMAMVLNDEVWSSANIAGKLTDNVQISRGGGGYSEEDQKWLLSCLRAGSLKLKPELESQENVGATLGATAIQRGEIAFAVGGIAVVIFMVVYYSLAGFLAVIALLLNFLFVFAILMLLESSLTLPGIAGLVLTVGMAVDANILIFERIREELDKGKRLIHAAKNGFDRAFITIFDANLTTFIVAAFLVYYGKGPIKGFGYTLMTGIVCSMFSGLYITRTLLGTAIARGWIKELKMRRLMDKPNFSFLEKAKPAMTGSIVIIVLGLVAFFIRGDDKYGLDFNGGTSVRMNFQSEVVDSDIKSAIADIKDKAGKSKYKSVAASAIAFGDNKIVGGKSKVIDVRLDYTKSDNDAAIEGEQGDGSDPFEVVRNELITAFGDKLVPDPMSEVAYSTDTGTWSAVINLTDAVSNVDAIKQPLLDAGLNDPQVVAVDSAQKIWRVSAVMTAEAAKTIESSALDKLLDSDDLSLTKRFPKVRYVGPTVVSGLKTAAFQAMIVSLLFILGYIWFRFKEIKYGVAAAAALVHDVLISLGVVIAANWSGLVEVPISLNVIAAFLTIIGYSLNDTIVVFDRIRENLGNSRGTFGEIVNRSINQTLSRTVLTSATTFFVIAAIFVANYGIESPLEGLSFTLLIGVIVGTYSSIFIASPVLIWAHKRDEASKSKSKNPRVVTDS
ncbi:MAG: SecD/SecF fusion protein [Planctomycetota bacterium]